MMLRPYRCSPCASASGGVELRPLVFGERLGAFHSEADLCSDGAAGAIGADQILSADVFAVPRRGVAQCCDDSGGTLLEPDKLAGKLKLTVLHLSHCAPSVATGRRGVARGDLAGPMRAGSG
jgi:hypothetical protein